MTVHQPDMSALSSELRSVSLPEEAFRVAKIGAQSARGAASLALGFRSKRSLDRRLAHELRMLFTHLGPAYVKLGQLIASSPGVFPQVLSDEMEKLLDRVRPMPYAVVERVIIEQLGAHPDELFGSFEQEPLASASIAQVHRATLIDGTPVAVKVQRPRIAHGMAADLQVLKHLAAVVSLSKFGRMLNAKEIVADFQETLGQELDFRNEIGAMRDWTEAIAGTQFEDTVRTPHVYDEFSGRRVMTMEFVDGLRIDNAKELRKAGWDTQELVKNLFLSLMETALRGGIFHGDLHAGNILVDRAGTLVFLDFGITGRFDETRRPVMRKLIGDLIVRNDHAGAGEALIALGAIRNPSHDTAKDIGAISEPLGSTALGQLSYTSIGKQLSGLAKEYDVRLPRELVLVTKQFLYVERYIKLLAPKWRTFTDPRLVRYLAVLLNQTDGRSQRTARGTAVTDDPTA